MTKRNVLLAGVWAMGTFGVAMAAGLPATLDAVDQPRQVILQEPVLKVAGMEFSINYQGKRAYSAAWSIPAGSKANVLLHAVNTTGRAANADVVLTLTSTPSNSGMGRVLPTPREFWTCRQRIALDANESRDIPFTSDPLPANAVVYLDLHANGQTLSLSNFVPLVSAEPTTKPTVGS
jgi:hypothetical protein